MDLTRRGLIAGATIAAAGTLISAPRSVVAQPAPAGAESPRPLSDDVVTANRILAQHGVLDTLGHVSARDDRNAGRYLLSRSRAPELVTADDIMEHDLDSNPLEARGRPPYLERFIHGEIYKLRPDVHAIVHSHTPSLLPFGVSSVPLRPIFQGAAFIVDGVPVFEVRDGGRMTDLLVRNGGIGRSLAQALGNKNALLMRSHGAVVVGPSVRNVVQRCINLDLNARLLTQALALGGTVSYLHPEEARLILAREDVALERSWELWKRKALAK